MAFFARWKQQQELKKIAKQVERNPSPAGACALIEKYIESAQLEEAEKVARQSVEFYPFSNTVQRAYRYLKKVKYYDQLRRLTNQIEKKPTPTLYAMLAELYNELGETDRTLDVCREGIKRFPDYEGMYVIMGKIRYKRYLQEGLPRDGMLAVEFFEKALQLNEKDYKTFIRLSEIYLELGMRSKAIEKLNSVLYFAPEDERANELLKRAQALPPESASGGLDIEEQFKQLRQRRESQEKETRSIRFSPKDIESKLWSFGELSSLLAAVCTTIDGRKIASKILKEGVNEDALCIGLWGNLFCHSGLVTANGHRRFQAGSSVRLKDSGSYVQV